MQNDIVKPPVPAQPSQPPRPISQPIGNEVHAAPKTSLSPQQQIPSPKQAPVQEQQPDTLLSTAKKPKARKPLGAIIAALLVFVSLGSGAVYVAMQDQKGTNPTVATTQAPATTGNTNVAGMSTEIDDALNEAAQLPTSNEDPASDLSDQTLGL